MTRIMVTVTDMSVPSEPGQQLVFTIASSNHEALIAEIGKEASRLAAKIVKGVETVEMPDIEEEGQ